jgi:hypothetical protein
LKENIHGGVLVSTGYAESDKHGAEAGYCLSIRRNN